MLFAALQQSIQHIKKKVGGIVTSFIKIEIYLCKPHQLCNGKCAHLKCCRLWVRALVGSNKRPKTEKLVFDSSPLSTQPSEVITTGWLRIRIMFLSGATCETAYLPHIIFI